MSDTTRPDLADYLVEEAASRTAQYREDLAREQADPPVQVVIAWPATIYVTVEVERGDDLAGVTGQWDVRITRAEVTAKDEGDDDNPDGWVYDVRRGDLDAVGVGPEVGRAALAFVADSQWPDPTLTA
jgi:hypothetical protein